VTHSLLANSCSTAGISACWRSDGSVYLCTHLGLMMRCFEAIETKIAGGRESGWLFCPTPVMRRKFAPYWYVIRPVSGLIRRRMLGRIRQQAEGLASQ
jgi:hypothetical protein